MQKGQVLIFLLVAILIIAAAGGAYYLGRSTSPKPSAIPTAVSQTPQPTPSPTPSDETVYTEATRSANWKTYTHGYLTFKYPLGWTANDFNYANSVIIENMKSSVKITVSEGQYPYGFTGPQNIKKNLLKVVVDGKEYQTTENVIDNKKAYVDFELDTPQKHHILFGTGYPADDDLNISLEDYYSSKDTIRKILSTFKFTP